MPKRVSLGTQDLLFRSKLGAVITAAGGEVVRDPAPCDLAVLDVEIPGAMDRIRGLVASGIPVLAYGSHVLVDLLRSAREAGAIAVPNSEIERRLRALVSG
jgi:hypothetical protein